MSGRLIDDFKAECVLLKRRQIPDGEGGQAVEEWAEGAVFDAAITAGTSMQVRAAEKQGAASSYTVTTDKSVTLQYHDVFRRLEDGKIFRVTRDGGDVQTPARATFQFSQVTAEKWELPQ